MLDKVVYLPMPITVDEKREWNAKGYAVLDEIYEPANEVAPTEEPAGPEPEPQQEPEPVEPEPEPQPKRGK
jgi:hypothetical protein